MRTRSSGVTGSSPKKRSGENDRRLAAQSNEFARDVGILDADVPYENVVATELAFWR